MAEHVSAAGGTESYRQRLTEGARRTAMSYPVRAARCHRVRRVDSGQSRTRTEAIADVAVPPRTRMQPSSPVLLIAFLIASSLRSHNRLRITWLRAANCSTRRVRRLPTRRSTGGRRACDRLGEAQPKVRRWAANAGPAGDDESRSSRAISTERSTVFRRRRAPCSVGASRVRETHDCARGSGRCPSWLAEPCPASSWDRLVFDSPIVSTGAEPWRTGSTRG